MTNEVADENDSLDGVGKSFDSFRAGNALISVVEQCEADLVAIRAQIMQTLPYLINQASTNHQHQLAEQRLRDLRDLLASAYEQLQAALSVAPALHYPVPVNT